MEGIFDIGKSRPVVIDGLPGTTCGGATPNKVLDTIESLYAIRGEMAPCFWKVGLVMDEMRVQGYGDADGEFTFLAEDSSPASEVIVAGFGFYDRNIEAMAALAELMERSDEHGFDQALFERARARGSGYAFINDVVKEYDDIGDGASPLVGAITPDEFLRGKANANELRRKAARARRAGSPE